MINSFQIYYLLLFKHAVSHRDVPCLEKEIWGKDQGKGILESGKRD